MVEGTLLPEVHSKTCFEMSTRCSLCSRLLADTHELCSHKIKRKHHAAYAALPQPLPLLEGSQQLWYDTHRDAEVIVSLLAEFAQLQQISAPHNTFHHLQLAAYNRCRISFDLLKSM